MPNRSGATYYCPACERVGAATNKYNHSRTKRHRRLMELKFPLPENPWAVQNKGIVSTPILRHLSYLDSPERKHE